MSAAEDLTRRVHDADTSRTEAMAEAEARWGGRRLSDRLPIDWLDEGMASGFVLGAQWQANRTDARVLADMVDYVLNLHHPMNVYKRCDVEDCDERDDRIDLDWGDHAHPELLEYRVCSHCSDEDHEVIHPCPDRVALDRIAKEAQP